MHILLTADYTFALYVVNPSANANAFNIDKDKDLLPVFMDPNHN